MSRSAHESLNMPPATPLISLGLQRIKTLLRTLSSPHLATPVVHIAGTNGKGSVSAYLSSILTASNIRVGRFNSPHLVDEWDCLQLGGRTVEQATFEQAKRQVELADKSNGIGATSFEILAATAFTIFAQAEPQLDLAVVEVGMGGATDATNVVPAEQTLLSVITPIELDHQKFLGDTIEEIARVKAGIVKRDVPVVLAKQAHPEVVRVVTEVAQETDACVWHAGEGKLVRARKGDEDGATTAPLVELPLMATNDTPGPSSLESLPSSLQARLPLPGAYQLSNAATAVLAARVLQTSPRAKSLANKLANITDGTISTGIEQTRWPGRLDWLSLPAGKGRRSTQSILIDGAHNPSSAETLSTYVQSLPIERRPTTLIIGISSPRPPASLLTPLLSPVDGTESSIRRVVCVPFSLPESMPWIKPTEPKEIAEVARRFPCVVEVVLRGSVGGAIEELREDERALVAGSLYLAADVYRYARANGEGG